MAILYEGGVNWCGTMWTIKSTGHFALIYGFPFYGPEGSDPEANLTAGKNGILYGTTVVVAVRPASMAAGRCFKSMPLV